MQLTFILVVSMLCVVMAKGPDSYNFWHGRWNKYVILQNGRTNPDDAAAASAAASTAAAAAAGGGGGGGGGGGSGGGVRVDNHIHLHLSSAQWEAIKAIAQTNTQENAQSSHSRFDASFVQSTAAPNYYVPESSSYTSEAPKENDSTEAPYYYHHQQENTHTDAPKYAYYEEPNAQTKAPKYDYQEANAQTEAAPLQYNYHQTNAQEYAPQNAQRYQPSLEYGPPAAPKY